MSEPLPIAASHRPPIWHGALLVLAVLIVFGPLCAAGFTWWDDSHTVHQNPNLNPQVTWAGLAYHWTRASASIYIPLTYTAWAALAVFARVPADDAGISLNPAWFHTANVVIHAISAYLAWRLLRRLLNHDVAALIGALVYALHPMQVESVAWISGLKDVLSGCLVLGALCCYVAPGRARYATAIVLYLLAMLAKPSAMTAPLLMLAIDRLLIGRSWKQSLTRLAPLLALTLPIAWIARVVQMAPVAPPPLWVRPLVAMDSLAFYLAKVIAPVTLTIDYGRKPATVMASGAIRFSWVVPCAALVLVAAISRRWKSNLPWCAAALFFLAPLPVLGLAPFDFQEVSTVADHYVYVALIGVALLAGWLAMRSRWAMRLVIIWACVLGGRALAQTFVWQDETTLMTHAVRVNPRSVIARQNLSHLARLAGDWEAERRYLLEAEQADPNNPITLAGLARISLRDGDDAAAHFYFRRLFASFENVFGRGHPMTARPRWQAARLCLDHDRLADAHTYAADALRITPEGADTEVLNYLRANPAKK